MEMNYCCFHEYIQILRILIYVIHIYDICTLRFEVGSVNRQKPIAKTSQVFLSYSKQDRDKHYQQQEGQDVHGQAHCFGSHPMKSSLFSALFFGSSPTLGNRTQGNSNQSINLLTDATDTLIKNPSPSVTHCGKELTTRVLQEDKTG